MNEPGIHNSGIANFSKKRLVEMWITLASCPHFHKIQQQQFFTCLLTCNNLKLSGRFNTHLKE